MSTFFGSDVVVCPRPSGAASASTDTLSIPNAKLSRLHNGTESCTIADYECYRDIVEGIQ
jgi:hypothetical protein